MKTSLTNLGIALALLMISSDNLCALNIFSMADQSTYRCPDGLVAVGDSDRSVRSKCGNPIDVLSVQDAGPIWIYQQGQAKFMYYLEFRNGRLERIVSAPCRTGDPDCYDLR
jgi:hypothetical protein